MLSRSHTHINKHTYTHTLNATLSIKPIKFDPDAATKKLLHSIYAVQFRPISFGLCGALSCSAITNECEKNVTKTSAMNKGKHCHAATAYRESSNSTNANGGPRRFFKSTNVTFPNL